MILAMRTRITNLLIGSSLLPSSLPQPPQSIIHLRSTNWTFSPNHDPYLDDPEIYRPKTLSRLWFLSINQTHLLRDLVGVVDLENVIHENLCSFNTAVVVEILARRRRELAQLLSDLKRLERMDD